MDKIARFLEDSIIGFSIHGETRKLIAQRMNDILKMSGPLRIIELLNILNSDRF